MGRVILVDVRGLPPCEPMERVLQALRELAPGDEVRMLLHREPVPLYALLAEQGFAHRAQRQPDGHWAIRIRHAPAGSGASWDPAPA